MTIRPSLRNVVVSRRFVRDLKDKEKTKSLVNDVLDCSNLEFSELHKFEKNIGGNLIFRARKGNLHLVYGVNRKMSIIFLRAISNFTEYKKFLGNRKQILKMITHASP
jgi:mRNA-degrading endonuclease RelE of RelBE toxin-antitoxin system